MDNLDQFLKQCVKENSYEYIMKEYKKMAMYDCYISLTKETLLGMLGAAEIDYKEYKELLKDYSNEN